MFRSLNGRLLLSYFSIILVCLVLVGLGLLLFVWSSPLWTGTVYLRLEVAARAVTTRLGPLGTPPTEELEALLSGAAEEYGVRLLLLDAGGTVRFDSAEAWEGERLEELARMRFPWEGGRGTFVVSPGGRWAFVARTIRGPDRHPVLLLFLSPQPRLLMLSWFAQNLLPPLVEAGLVALVLSVLLAWLVSRSIARPLERVAEAARAIARGNLEYRTLVSGPQEVRDLARAFNQMADRVAAVQRAQQDLVVNISHELKTPLTSVQGFSQAILDGTAADAAMITRSARIIYDEAERMRRMVDELLSLARFDAGEMELARQQVDLRLLLESCVERMAPQARAADDVLELSVAEEVSVVGDPDWLTQVFVNLLDNAIRHTRGGRVEVTARPAGRWVEVTVSDTGEGIPPQDLDRIFERFYQADKSRQRRGGVGLGLSIAREVVHRHGGEITAESRVGEGSRFTVRLPAPGQEEVRPRGGGRGRGKGA